MSAPNTNLNNSHQPTGAIVGGIIGGVFALGIVLFIVAVLIRRRRMAPNETDEMSCGQVNSVGVESKYSQTRLSQMSDVRLKYLDGDRELPSARLGWEV